MTKPVRVLNVLSDLARGGTTQVIMNYYRNMDKTKVVYDFLCLTNDDGVYEQEIKQSGGRVFKVKPLTVDWKENLKFTNEFFKENHYDIVEIHSPSPLRFTYAVFSKIHGIKTIIFHAHNSNLKPTLKERICSKIINMCCDFKFSCSYLAGEYMYNGSDYKIIKNAIELDKFDFDINSRKAIRSRFGINDNQKVIGYLGRLDNKQKNLDFLIKVFIEVSKKSSDLLLMVVGDGDYKKDMIKKLSENNVLNNVIFVGMVDDPWSYYNSFDCFAITSFYEGFPVTLVEAQVNGLKIISSNKISEDTKVLSDLYYSLPIDNEETAIGLWRDAILESVSSERKSRLNDMRKAGFDIKIAARELENFYYSRREKSNA